MVCKDAGEEELFFVNSLSTKSFIGILTLLQDREYFLQLYRSSLVYLATPSSAFAAAYLSLVPILSDHTLNHFHC